MIRSLDQIADNPTDANELSMAETTAMLSRIAVAQSALSARLVAILTETQGQGHAEDDRLLTVDQAAQHLGLSEDWLYRHSDRLPFTVRVGRHVRFSAHGVERYIRERSGRRESD
jgi:excisionase family DNA binding protein